MKFKCSECGGEKIEEVMIDVNKSTEVLGLEDGAGLIYGSETVEGGDVDRYQCADCGEPVTGKDGRPVYTYSDMVSFLEEGKENI